MTSVHEHIPLRDSLGYTAAKHGLGGLTKGLALEAGVPRNHRQQRRARPDRDEDDRPGGARRASAATRGRPHRPPRQAHRSRGRVRFLASPEASYVTGSSYGVDGGMALMAQPAHPAIGQRMVERAVAAVKRTRAR